MAEHFATDRALGGTTGPVRDPTAMVLGQVDPELITRLEPASPEADPVVAAVTAQYAHSLGHRDVGGDDTELRHRLLTRLETANDPRRERYLQLLAVINGWPAPTSQAPVLDWFIRAVRARTAA